MKSIENPKVTAARNLYEIKESMIASFVSYCSSFAEVRTMSTVPADKKRNAIKSFYHVNFSPRKMIASTYMKTMANEQPLASSVNVIHGKQASCKMTPKS